MTDAYYFLRMISRGLVSMWIVILMVCVVSLSMAQESEAPAQNQSELPAIPNTIDIGCPHCGGERETTGFPHFQDIEWRILPQPKDPWAERNGIRSLRTNGGFILGRCLYLHFERHDIDGPTSGDIKVMYEIQRDIIIREGRRARDIFEPIQSNENREYSEEVVVRQVNNVELRETPIDDPLFNECLESMWERVRFEGGRDLEDHYIVELRFFFEIPESEN